MNEAAGRVYTISVYDGQTDWHFDCRVYSLWTMIV